MNRVISPAWHFLLLLIFVFASALTVYASQHVQLNEPPVISESLSKLQMQSLNRVEAPEFVLENLSGKRVKLSDFRGRVVLINFWTTW